MRKLFLFLLVFLTVPLFAESFVDGESFGGGESFTGGESFGGGESFVNGESFVGGESFVDGESFTGGRGQKVGVYESVVEPVDANIYDRTAESIYDEVDADIYVNGYGKYLKLMTERGVDARTNFVRYFSDWQWSGQKEDFFSYSASRADQEKQLARCYDTAIKKFGVGTAIVATTWIVAFAVPGGTIYQVAIIAIAKATTVGALSGGAVGAVSSAGVAYLQGKRGNELVCETIKGAADGYLIGAITGLVTGTVSAVKMVKDAPKFTSATGDTKTILNGKVYDGKGKEVGKYLGHKNELNGRAIINADKAGTTSPTGIKYETMLADDGKGNFFTVTNPDFSPVKITDKVYKAPRSLWKDSNATIRSCQQQYMKDLASPDVEKILGISRKEAAMRLQFEKGLNLRDASFLKSNGLSEKQVTEFLKRYDSGAWHHLPSSGDLIYVPKNHYQLAPHTGGDSFWGSKAGQLSWNNSIFDITGNTDVPKLAAAGEFAW